MTSLFLSRSEVWSLLFSLLSRAGLFASKPERSCLESTLFCPPRHTNSNPESILIRLFTVRSTVKKPNYILAPITLFTHFGRKPVYIPFMKIQNSLFLFAFTFSHFLFSQEKPNEISDPRGAIIIADMKGAVAVTNNSTGAALPAASVQPGKILFDGHTIKTTGKDSSIVLLLSNGTVTTLKADSVLNIKKFTQAKFDPGATKLSELEGEPSSSETLIDLNIGDMVVDIKKLDKKSNFNIESPVGTAGIRGTRIGMNIQQAPGGGSQVKLRSLKVSSPLLLLRRLLLLLALPQPLRLLLFP